MSSATALRDTIGSVEPEAGGCFDEATRVASGGELDELAGAGEGHLGLME